MTPHAESLPDDFVDNIRKLRSADVPRNELKDYIVEEITQEVTRGDGPLWVSFLDNHLAAIRQVIAENRRGDKVLQAVVNRLESMKQRASDT